ncbi:MAG: hypothetical protein OER43_09700 [Gammaproteobacteria bacterium]|nr:hypothetical protein [Gammaproteobacteria bacterium]MDH3411427.1 hypothetical protein [Gammaproteobacteria bacterium]
MPHAHDLAIRQSGTRVRLFAQSHYMQAFREPEIVWLAPPAGSVGPGPSDDRMYVVDPIGKEDPYEFPFLPPWGGPAHPPVEPDADGHFDYFDVNTRDFVVAHMYGGIRRVLDIWEGYFGRRIEWQFRPHFERLELIPVIDWDNAQSGYGFIETGFGPSQAGEAQPFCLNFDVLAHEFGHSMMFSEVGHDEATVTGEYLGFQEGVADLIALISALHFDSVLDRTLISSQGNLYAENETNRLGELSEVAEIRVADNMRKLSEFEQGWSDPHHLALPLVGAVFDCLVDVYQEQLLRAGLIDAELARLTNVTPYEELDEGVVHVRYAEAYQGRHEEFKTALIAARDYLGHCLVFVLTGTSPHFLRFADVGATLLEADRALSGGEYQQQFLQNLVWRDIGAAVVGPQLAEED